MEIRHPKIKSIWPISFHRLNIQPHSQHCTHNFTIKLPVKCHMPRLPGNIKNLLHLAERSKALPLREKRQKGPQNWIVSPLKINITTSCFKILWFALAHSDCCFFPSDILYNYPVVRCSVWLNSLLCTLTLLVILKIFIHNIFLFVIGLFIIFLLWLRRRKLFKLLQYSRTYFIDYQIPYPNTIDYRPLLGHNFTLNPVITNNKLLKWLIIAFITQRRLPNAGCITNLKFGLLRWHDMLI